MSLKSLEKYLERNPVIQPRTQRNRTPIIVSDSKGSRLERCVQNIQPESSIVWECKGDRNSFQAAQFVKANLEYYVSKYGNILLVIWTGTCDLTQFIHRSKPEVNQPYRRRKRYIDFSSIYVCDILAQSQQIISAVKVFGPKVKVVFLECPQYSISIWNETQGHPDFESFKSNTEILNSTIEDLNKSIRKLNSENKISAPKFGLDLIKSRKSNKSYTSVKVSYSLLGDGIHPGLILSRYWLRRVINSLLLVYCYE